MKEFRIEKVDLCELKGGIDQDFSVNGCGITNGQCMGANAGCGLFNGDCK